jgi:hypothetical protein
VKTGMKFGRSEMTAEEFESEIRRLNENFKGFYTKTKTKVLANIVMDLSKTYFSKCIDKVMWSDKPPKIEWFHEIVSRFRRNEKMATRIEDMHPMDGSIFSPKDISMMRTYARRKLDDNLSDEDYTNFQMTIRAMVAARPDIKCKKCLDQGVYFLNANEPLIECDLH